ncbi:MAG: hypothetical protein GY922_01965 [Proteobacteria bacterium]|nr:hypothetical protein [Pseudomonadota bacterium]
MLFAVDLHEDFVDVEGIAVASVLALQSAGINRSEFYAPETYRLSSDSDASFGEEVFDVAMTQIESVVKPDTIGNNIRWGAPSGNRWRL